MLRAEVLNPVFKRLNVKAAEYLSKPILVLQVLKRALDKAVSLEGENGLQRIKDDAFTLIRLVSAVMRKKYHGLPYKSLVKAFAGVLYFLFVEDLIPDFIPVLGFADDTAVIGWVVKSIRADLDKFRSWEHKRNIEAKA